MAASYLFYEMLTCTLHFLCDVNGETQLSPPLTLTLTLTSYLLHYSHASFPEEGGGGRRGVRQKEEKSWWRGYLQYSPSNAWKNSNSNCACNVRTNWTMLRSANNLLTSISDKHIPSLADFTEGNEDAEY